MTTAMITAKASGFVAAPAAQVYELLADYRRHHPHFLPDEFSDYKVLEGGRGAGTVVTVKVTLQGGARTSTLEVSEPEPGHVLEEHDRTSGTLTRFTVEPTHGGSTVSIETSFPRSPGLRAFAEALLAPNMLRRLYRKELRLLASYAAGDPLR
jgi:hypothetical protein